MRPSLALFMVVLVVVAVLAVANLERLFAPIRLSLAVAEYDIAAILVGLISILGVALAFTLVASLSDTRAKARTADYLSRIDDLRLSLDKEEASRFAALSGSLEAHVRTLSSRLDALGDTLASRQDSLLASVNERVDKVRDELAADIGAVEDTLLRAQGASSPSILIEADPPRRT